ncbi:MAG: hypothetical protein PVI24_07570 [Myxococcales bacterium]
MRLLLLSCACLVACTKPEPVQDPLDYLRVGVDPRVEANSIEDDLRAHGFEIGRRIEGPDYVAFDASDGAKSTVRLVTSRGPVLSIQVPDVRWPERLSVALADGPRPDFDGDGRGDVVVSIRERERVCLAWVQVSTDGYVSEAFRPRQEWGDSPCVIEIDAMDRRVLLEVAVPDATESDARVRIPVQGRRGEWVLDQSPKASSRWDLEIESRQRALETAQNAGDFASARRLRAELDWLDQLRKARAPVLEPGEDGEAAR